MPTPFDPTAVTLAWQSLDLSQFHVIRRNGELAPFDPGKISMAMTKAFLAVEGHQRSPARIHATVEQLTSQVVQSLTRRMPQGGSVHIEDIQDQVELAMMRAGEHKVARDYVLYREERAKLRREREHAQATHVKAATVLHLTALDGTRRPLDPAQLATRIAASCIGLTDVDPASILQETLRNLFDGASELDLSQALVMSARTLIETDPHYSYVTARLLLDQLRTEAYYELGMTLEPSAQAAALFYPDYFLQYLRHGITHELLDPRLAQFDLPQLAAALRPEQDLQFNYLGLQTLCDRYFLHRANHRFELPQAFFMRVAMGLALNEIDRETRAIEFYQLISRFDLMSSTPTLFNAGTLRPQLSSCYLTTVADDLDGIFGAIKDNALLSKFAGGLGNDWTQVRGMNARIKGTNGLSQGVVPFLKVANDTAVAVNQCLAPDAYIHTADGIKAMRDVQIGNLVLGISGTYREVTQVMLYNQHEAMVALEVQHAIEPVKITAGHPLYALRGVPLEQANEPTDYGLNTGKLKPEWVEAGQLQIGDYVAQVIPTETVRVDGVSADDARLYGILLGNGHLTQDGMQWGVSSHPHNAGHQVFVRAYLAKQGIPSWETGRGEAYAQLHWASGCGVVRNATNGHMVGAGTATLPFTYDDLYNAQGAQRISRKFSHLPRQQTLALLQGLLETSGGVSQDEAIYFTTTSRALAESLRYQCLRLGIPTAGQCRERDATPTDTRSDGTPIEFNGVSKTFAVRIPAVPDIAALVNCPPIAQHDWLTYHGCLFSRVRGVTPIPPLPFVFDLLVEGDASYMTTAALVSNGGKRKGAVCAYLETWHIDIEEFLELRKNTGEERRRTHDMNTANWVPDLFMQRVAEDGAWTLFSPDETPDLHDLIGQDFAARYATYETLADQGKIRIWKRLRAQDLWRKMLAMLFETGHPWITFKDACNLRSPQQHVGRVHSSNLCTEITLNTSDSEIAVCNLASINLAQHLTPEGQLDTAHLHQTIHTAVRMLDNVIDINYYGVPQARRSNLRHRPVGLGIMGFQDCLYQLRLPYASEAAVEFADRSMEWVSYLAILASTALAEERGRYPSFTGSLWSRGILPLDSIALLAAGRGGYLEMDTSYTLDWESLRARVLKFGMRNSNVMAIAPTATISNICGVNQSIEPSYKNLHVKSNLSGEFTSINPYLVQDLKALGLWDRVMVHDLKYYDGSVQAIERLPDALKQLYATAFEMDARWLVEAGSRRQKWLDQAQSLNLYMAEPSGKKLDNLYKLAWVRGLKTTYYLRSLGATHVEKSTLTDSKLNAVRQDTASVPQACAIDNPDCEACQ